MSVFWTAPKLPIEKLQKSRILLLKTYYFCFKTESLEDLFELKRPCPTIFQSISGTYVPLLAQF